MSDSIREEVNTTETDDQTHSLTVLESEDVNSASSSFSTPVTSEEVPKQIKALTDSLAKQRERLCNLRKKLRQVPQKVFFFTT